MALLQNEEYLIYLLRTSYLTHNKDGNGERLINLDNLAVLNDPVLRNLGLATQGELKRCHSPPIPTTAAISSDYFSAPIRSAGFPIQNFEDEDEQGGLVSGKGSDTVGPGAVIKRRRRREQQEEDDSSDLSDESDEEPDSAQRDAQKIKFSKMPNRSRAGSSPLRKSSFDEGKEVLLTSPMKRMVEARRRRGSMGAVEAVKQRARTDTTTSSDMSSENELDPSVFRRRTIKPNRSGNNVNFNMPQDVEEGDEEDELERLEEEELDPTSGDDSAGSLSSDFAEADGSGSLMPVPGINNTYRSGSMGHLPPGMLVPPPLSPKKPKTPISNTLEALPPPRPISTIQPISALGQAIRATKTKPKNPVETFARLSGKGEASPLNIRIYAPFSKSPDKPFEMPLLRTVLDTESNAQTTVTVADAIGLSLFRYQEEGLEPSIPREKQDVNRWTLRIVDDGEVEYDFPALNRVRNITDFTSNNNRPARGRGRGKTFDEFALVEATDTQYEENKMLTPKYTRKFEESSRSASDVIRPIPENPSESAVTDDLPPLDTIVPKPFAFIQRKQSAGLADQPDLPTVHSAIRMGPPKLLKIHFTSLEANTQVNTIEVTTDTYIAEVLEQVCRRFHLDKAHHFLKVTGTNTVAPLDRTVESIGARTDLDLVRRRFAYDPSMGVGFAGSPSSASPNTPLNLSSSGPITRKGKKGLPASNLLHSAHPLAISNDLWTFQGNNKRYLVIRKQTMSFATQRQSYLIIDTDYIHVVPTHIPAISTSTALSTTTTATAASSNMANISINLNDNYTPGAALHQFATSSHNPASHPIPRTVFERDAPAGAGLVPSTAMAKADKTITVPYSLIVGCKQSRRHPKSFRVLVFREKETKRYDFEAVNGKDDAEVIVAEVRRRMEVFGRSIDV